jgi:hypothetical protein
MTEGHVIGLICGIGVLVCFGEMVERAISLTLTKLCSLNCCSFLC